MGIGSVQTYEDAMRSNQSAILGGITPMSLRVDGSVKGDI